MAIPKDRDGLIRCVENQVDNLVNDSRALTRKEGDDLVAMLTQIITECYYVREVLRDTRFYEGPVNEQMSFREWVQPFERCVIGDFEVWVVDPEGFDRREFTSEPEALQELLRRVRKKGDDPVALACVSCVWHEEWESACAVLQDALHGKPPIQARALSVKEASALPQFKNSLGQPAHSKPDGSDWSIAEWTNALAGEAGEAANVAKKIRRGDLDMHGGRQLLLKELADVVIYADLTAKQLAGDLGQAVQDKFNEVSNRVGVTVFLREREADDMRKLFDDAVDALYYGRHRTAVLKDNQIETYVSRADTVSVLAALGNCVAEGTHDAEALLRSTLRRVGPFSAAMEMTAMPVDQPAEVEMQEAGALEYQTIDVEALKKQGVAFGRVELRGQPVSMAGEPADENTKSAMHRKLAQAFMAGIEMYRFSPHASDEVLHARSLKQADSLLAQLMGKK